MAEEKGTFPIYYAIPLVIVMGIVLLGGWKMFFDSDNDALPSTREGGIVPSIVRLSAFDGADGFTHDDLTSGGVKLVNFWASWCAPCRAEHPQLETLAQEGVVINGINYKDDPANARRFLEQLGDPFAKLMADADGRTGLDWGLYGVPETFIIAADGTVVKRFAGPITESILESVIRPAMEDAASR